jgi:hypothetical protein
MADSLMSKGADSLGPRSREFYESTAFKLFLSITYGAFAIMFLGFSSAGKRTKLLLVQFPYFLSIASYLFSCWAISFCLLLK